MIKIKRAEQFNIKDKNTSPLQGGERSCKRGACYKCGEGVEPSIGAPLEMCAMANKWKIESLPQPYQLHLFRPGGGGCRVATGGVILC